jgi:hypothetical protein
LVSFVCQGQLIHTLLEVFHEVGVFGWRMLGPVCWVWCKRWRAWVEETCALVLAGPPHNRAEDCMHRARR